MSASGAWKSKAQALLMGIADWRDGFIWCSEPQGETSTLEIHIWGSQHGFGDS